MLERFTDNHRARRRLGPAASLSIVAHAGALAALLCAAAWQMDKLVPADPPILLAAGFGAPLPAPVEGPEKQQVKLDAKVRTDEIRQPEENAPTAHKPGGTGGTEKTGAGPGLNLSGTCPPFADCAPSGAAEVEKPACGDRVIEAGEECDDGGRDGGDGCSADCRLERETVVVARVIEGQRIAGESQIPAQESVRADMARTGRSQVVGMVKMCLGRDGAVRSLRVLRPTGYPEYDERLTARMQDWRYRPYRTADGVPLPVCTVVTFIYRLH